MLIEFSVANFLSFKDKVTFSMLASSIKEHNETNVFDSGKHKLLKSAAIYGANASGKSNLIKAMGFMRNLVINSSKETQAGEKINGILPFLLNTETTNQPSFFEIVFQLERSIYRYGFELNSDNINSEWLFETTKQKEKKLFSRSLNKISSGIYFKEGDGIESRTRENALFLSVVAQNNGEISKNILQWFFNFRIMSGLDDWGFMPYTINQLEIESEKKKIERLINIFDLGFNKLKIYSTPVEDKVKIEQMPKGSYIGNIIKNKKERKEILSYHKVFNKNNKIVGEIAIPVNLFESEGTKKIIALSAPLIDTFENSVVFVIDEFDARLHPLLTKKIIELFNSNDINKNNAQLIFATHDTNLLSNDLLRRDQIWFTEKNKYGATDLYSLVEFKKDGDKKVRNDASYEKDYILGKYGAIPFIGDTANILG